MINQKSKIKNQKLFEGGQVALVVLVVSAVALTLGLSLSKKTVIETQVETDEEALKQAFNAAESGVDYYLSTGTTKYTAPDGKSMAEVTVSNVGGSEVISFGDYTPENNYTYFWLVSHFDDGSINYGDYYRGDRIDVCVEGGFAGSLLMGYFFRDGSGNFGQKRYVINFGGSQSIPNQSNLPNGSCNSGSGPRLPVVAGTTPLLITVMPLFGGGRIAIENVGGNLIPIQGTQISSLGKAGEVSATTGVSRRLSVEKRYKIPGFAMEAVMSGGRVLN